MRYFDHNATTQMTPDAFCAFQKASEDSWFNATSPYRAGIRVYHLLEEKRLTLSKILNCDPDLIVFNSGATEGNNSLIRYFSNTFPSSPIAISSIEHDSLKLAAETFFRGKVATIPVNLDGIVNLDALQQILETQLPCLVSIIAVNHEIGTIQPWKAALEICQNYQVPLHIDASQWCGKLPANLLGECDFVTGSAHKLGGPKGIGFIKIGPPHQNYCSQVGGGQEMGHRAGTSNYPSIASMMCVWESLEAMIQPSASTGDNPLKLWIKNRNDFEALLQEAIPGLTIAGQQSERIWNTSCIILPQGESLRWIQYLEKRGFYAGTGSACASSKNAPSNKTLSAIGFTHEQINRSIRITGGWKTSLEDWKALAHALIEGDNFFTQEKSSSSRSIASMIDI